MADYRARHHKYIPIPDARDVILDRHRGAAPAVAARVPSGAVQQIAAQVAPLWTPEVHDAARQLQQAARTQVVAEAYAAAMPEAPAAAPAEKPYVAVRPRGIVVSGRVAAPAFADFPEVVGASQGIPIVVSGTSRLADIPLPLDPPAEPEVEYTLETLPIGHHDFEYLSGTAGTGKTWLAKKLLELSPVGTVALAATTGIASVNLGEGTTIHSLLGFFDSKSLLENFHNGHLQSMLRKHRNAGLRRILLDEVSMLDGRMLTAIVKAIVEVNQPRDRALESVGTGDEWEDETPAGDIPPQLGLTIVGDFAQLPPVPDSDDQGNKIPAQFAFESVEWGRFAEHTTKLERVRRQDNVAFVEALHAVRKGNLRAAMSYFTPEKFRDTTDDHFPGSTVVATNKEVERRNQTYLDNLNTPVLTVDSRRWGKQRGDWKLIPDRLTLKETALVMILANEKDPDTGRMIYANGDLGILRGRDADGLWLVELRRTGKVVKVSDVARENTIPLSPGRRKELVEQSKSHLITKNKKNEIVGTIAYMPLRCAHACTVHKTQGLTLDQVQVNIRDGFFKQPGMLFVALSRARTPEGLRIVGDPRGFMERCKVDGRVVPWL